MNNPVEDTDKKESVGKGGHHYNNGPLKPYYDLLKVSERTMNPPKWDDLIGIGFRICRNKS